MEITKEIIQGLTILLPGFVTTGVIRSLYYGDVDNDFDKVSKSLIFTFVDYLTYTVSLQIWAWLFHQGGAPRNVDVTKALPTSPLQILLLFGISVFVGVVTVAYKNHNGHRIFKKLNISSETTFPNTWHEAFRLHGNTFVIINFEDGRRLSGWIDFFNRDVSQPMLYVTKADWLSVDSQGNQIVTPCPNGVLILSGAKISFIEFMDNQSTIVTGAPT